jgi:ActR/RegA family two-component response regulator
MKKPRALIVDPEAEPRGALARAFRSDHSVTVAGTLSDAIEILLLSEALHTLVVTLRLPDGAGMDVVRTAAVMVPTPEVIVLADDATAEEAFTLGRLGVTGIVARHATSDQVRRAIDDGRKRPPLPLYATLGRYVGHMSLLDFEGEVRRAMLLQALARAGNSRSAAARLLRTSRQMVQKAARLEDV